MKYLIFYIASLALGGAGAWLISRWGTTMGLLDRANDRSSHKGVVPKGGGIGILAAFLLASWVVGLSYSLNDFMVLCAFLFPFYADELTTMIVRIREDGSADYADLRRLKEKQKTGSRKGAKAQKTQR